MRRLTLEKLFFLNTLTVTSDGLHFTDLALEPGEWQALPNDLPDGLDVRVVGRASGYAAAFMKVLEGEVPICLRQLSAGLPQDAEATLSVCIARNRVGVRSRFIAAIDGEEIDAASLVDLTQVVDMAVDEQNDIVVLSGPRTEDGAPMVVAVNPKTGRALQSNCVADSGRIECTAALAGNTFVILGTEDGLQVYAKWSHRLKFQILDVPVADTVFATPDGHILFGQSGNQIFEIYESYNDGHPVVENRLRLAPGENLHSVVTIDHENEVCSHFALITREREGVTEFQYQELDLPIFDTEDDDEVCDADHNT